LEKYHRAAVCCAAANLKRSCPGDGPDTVNLPHWLCEVMRSVIAVIAFVACAHAGLWALARQEANAPDLDHQLASVSYAPFGGEVHPDSADAVSADRIRSDLRTLSPLTRAVRTYSATGGVELVPEIANEFGLK